MKISDILVSRIYQEVQVLISYYAQHNLPAFVKLEVDSFSDFSLITPLDTVLMLINDPNPLIQHFENEQVMFNNLLDPFTLVNQLPGKKADFNQALLKAKSGTAIIAIQYWTNTHYSTLLDPIFVHNLETKNYL